MRASEEIKSEVRFLDMKFLGRDYGDACAAATALCTANNSFKTPRNFVDSNAFAPSDLASLGLSWTSMKTPSTPAATAERASNGINSGWPPLTDWSPSAEAEGSWTEWVASKTTGANLRMIASERMSTTRLL